VQIVLKSGSLSLLDPSGSVKACNGIALPFYIYLWAVSFFKLDINNLPNKNETLCEILPPNNISIIFLL
jgi:hypothetical protein